MDSQNDVEREPISLEKPRTAYPVDSKSEEIYPNLKVAEVSENAQLMGINNEEPEENTEPPTTINHADEFKLALFKGFIKKFRKNDSELKRYKSVAFEKATTFKEKLLAVGTIVFELAFLILFLFAIICVLIKLSIALLDDLKTQSSEIMLSNVMIGLILGYCTGTIISIALLPAKHMLKSAIKAREFVYKFLTKWKSVEDYENALEKETSDYKFIYEIATEVYEDYKYIPTLEDLDKRLSEKWNNIDNLSSSMI